MLGQAVEVRVDDIDPQGKVSLSLASAPEASQRLGLGLELERQRWRRERRRRGHRVPPAPPSGRHRPSRTRSRPSWWRTWAIWAPAPPRPTPAGATAVTVVTAATTAAPARSFPPSLIETSVLPSGIRLVTETMADVRSVAVAFWVGTGSRDEPGELAGASHFLEHLLFKGTEDAVRRGHRRGARRGGGRLQRLHHQGVHDVLRPPPLREPGARARHPERHHVGAGTPLRGHRGRAHRDPRRDPHARRRARRPGVGALAVGALPGPRARARHAGDGVIGAADHPRGHPRLLRSATTGPPTWSSRWPGTARTRRWPPTSSAASRGRAGGAAPLPYGAGARRGHARRGASSDRAGAPRLRHALGVAIRRAALGAGRAEPRPRGRPVEPAVPKGARAARAGLLGVVGAGGLRGRRLAGRGGRDGARARRQGAAHHQRGARAAGDRGRDRSGAGRGQGKPARRDAPLGRGLRRPDEPHRRLPAAARRGPPGRRGAGPHRRRSIASRCATWRPSWPPHRAR